MSIEAILTALSGSPAGYPLMFFAVLIYGVIQLLNIGIAYLKKSLDKKEKEKGIIKRDEADRIIQGLIDNAISVIGGERIQVVEFTNSNKNIAFVPFNYMTCTYETYPIGKQSMADVCKSVPVTLMGMFLHRLARVSFLVLNSESVTNEFPLTTYDMLKKRMAIKSIYVPIKSPHSMRMVGYILHDSNEADGFTDSTIKTLTSVADRVGLLLTLGEW